MAILSPFEQGSQAFIVEFSEHVVVACRYPNGSHEAQRWDDGYNSMDCKVQQEMTPLSV